MWCWRLPFTQPGSPFDVEPPKSGHTVATLSVLPPSADYVRVRFPNRRRLWVESKTVPGTEVFDTDASPLSTIQDRRAVGGVTVYIESFKTIDTQPASFSCLGVGMLVLYLVILLVALISPLLIADVVVGDDLYEDSYRPLRWALAFLSMSLALFMLFLCSIWWKKIFYVPFHTDWLNRLSTCLEELVPQLNEEFNQKYSLGWGIDPSRNDGSVLVQVVANGNEEEGTQVNTTSTSVPSEERTQKTFSCKDILKNRHADAYPVWQVLGEHHFADLWNWGALVVSLRGACRPFQEAHVRRQQIGIILSIVIYMVVFTVLVSLVPKVPSIVWSYGMFISLWIGYPFVVEWYTECWDAANRHEACRLAVDEYSAMAEDHVTYRVDPPIGGCCLKKAPGMVVIYSRLVPTPNNDELS